MQPRLAGAVDQRDDALARDPSIVLRDRLFALEHQDASCVRSSEVDGGLRHLQHEIYATRQITRSGFVATRSAKSVP